MENKLNLGSFTNRMATLFITAPLATIRRQTYQIVLIFVIKSIPFAIFLVPKWKVFSFDCIYDVQIDKTRENYLTCRRTHFHN